MILLFGFFRAITAVIARTPFPVLYFFSGFLKFFLQFVVRYRKDVMRKNLRSSFPEKSRQEIKILMDQSYRNLADLIFEVIKLETISRESLIRKLDFTGLEIIREAFSRGKSVIITIGHCGNWEWMGTVLGMVLPVQGFAIIKPLADKHFNKYLESLRHRFNPGSTINFHHTYRAMIKNKREGSRFYVFAADQTPTRAEINYWSQFLNHDTPFYTGIEKLSKVLDLTVVYIDIHRTARGIYKGDICLVTDNPQETNEFEITEKYIRLLESSIIKRPENWLWSHRRWKFQKPVSAK